MSEVRPAQGPWRLPTTTEARMLALLEKALPIIEEEADRRDMADGDNPADSYWTEMRDLANEIAAEIAKAKGSPQ